MSVQETSQTFVDDDSCLELATILARGVLRRQRGHISSEESGPTGENPGFRTNSGIAAMGLEVPAETVLSVTTG